MATPSGNPDPSASANPPANNAAPPPTWAGTPAPPGSAGWGPTAPARKSRMPIVIVAVVVVVIVVLIVALALTGVIPGLGGSNNNNNNASTSGQTYSQSSPEATSAANGHGSGGYSAVYAIGYASTKGATLPVGTLSSAIAGTTCTFTSLSSTTSFTLGGSSNVTSGSYPVWVFLERNASNGILIVTVVDGTATVLGSIGGSSTCTSVFSVLSPLPSSMADSSAAALALDQRGGYAFANGHSPIVAGAFAFGGVLSYQSPEWMVSYAACDPTAAGTTGPEISATLTASAAVNSVSNTTTNCGFNAGSPGGGGGGGGGGTGGPLSSAFAIGTVTHGTEYGLPVYNFTVTSASTGITYGNLALSVTGSISLPAGSSVEVYSGTTPIAVYTFGSGWSAGTSTAIVVGNVLSLLAPSSVNGDTLVFTGAGGYTGTVSGSL